MLGEEQGVSFLSMWSVLARVSIFGMSVWCCIPLPCKKKIKNKIRAGDLGMNEHSGITKMRQEKERISS